MFIVENKDEAVEGVWFEFELRNEIVRFKVRPLFNDVIDKLRKKNRTVKKGVEIFNSDAIADGLSDQVLEDFEGFGGGDGKPLEPTLANKKMIMSILPLSDEQAISEFIFDKAKELALRHEEAVIKN